MSDDTDQQQPDWQPPADPQQGYGQDPYQQGGYPNYGYPQTQLQAVGHSRLGIASLIIGIIAALITVAGIVVVNFVSMQHPEIENLHQIEPGQPLPSELTRPLLAMMCPMCSGVMLALVGLILGIVGISMRGRIKLFSLIGTILNGLILLGFAALVVIGSLVGR